MCVVNAPSMDMKFPKPDTVTVTSHSPKSESFLPLLGTVTPSLRPAAGAGFHRGGAHGTCDS